MGNSKVAGPSATTVAALRALSLLVEERVCDGAQRGGGRC
jgi:hypothetical protein